METVPEKVTVLLQRMQVGDDSAIGRLLPLVYDELHGMAVRLFREQPSNHTLQATAIVHDAYLKLVQHGADWDGRRHFFVVASKAMRQMLADYARGRTAQKRGGGWGQVTLGGAADVESMEGADLVALDAAMTKLSGLSPRQGQIVELRFLGGLQVNEVAEVVGVSVATVGNEWRVARAFLRRELEAST